MNAIDITSGINPEEEASINLAKAEKKLKDAKTAQSLSLGFITKEDAEKTNLWNDAQLNTDTELHQWRSDSDTGREIAKQINAGATNGLEFVAAWPFPGAHSNEYLHNNTVFLIYKRPIK